MSSATLVSFMEDDLVVRVSVPTNKLVHINIDTDFTVLVDQATARTLRDKLNALDLNDEAGA